MPEQLNLNVPQLKRPPAPVSQTERVLRWLKCHGTITPLEAFHHFGTMRLARCIHDLRSAGHVIDTELVERSGSRFARYRLEV